ncbi:hypothetical protein E4U52_003309, partial [Claviceps spartinae]
MRSELSLALAAAGDPTEQCNLGELFRVLVPQPVTEEPFNNSTQAHDNDNVDTSQPPSQ